MLAESAPLLAGCAFVYFIEIPFEWEEGIDALAKIEKTNLAEGMD